MLKRVKGIKKVISVTDLGNSVYGDDDNHPVESILSDTSSLASILIQESTGGMNSANRPHMEHFVRHGYGINLWKSGAVYEGEWKNNRTHGKGVFWHSKGDFYIGQFDAD